MLKKKSIKAALNCNQISAYQTKKPLFRQMLKADKKCRLPSGVMLKHWTDTNRFAGIENKQTQSPLCSTSGCSQDSELPVRMHTCIPRSGTIGGATAAPAQTGKAKLGKMLLPNGQHGSDPILERGMCPTCESGVSKGHKQWAKPLLWQRLCCYKK